MYSLKDESAEKVNVYMVGMNDNPNPHHIKYILKDIRHDGIFAGGKRHHEILKNFLPEDAIWIEVKAPISSVLSEFNKHIQEGKAIVAFVSGDPLFYGFATTVKEKMDNIKMIIYPSFNSLQMFAHRLQIPYQDMHAVSVTGRPWHELDRALLECHSMIGVLTDHKHTPDAIAKRMIEYRLENGYDMYIAEHLGNPDEEQIYTNHTFDEIAGMSFNMPNCVLLKKKKQNNKYRQPLGIPDSQFTPLENREKMITKAPLRILDLSALNLHTCKNFWDIGACTGSVSIEAKKQYPHLHIHAFEIRTECKWLIDHNCHVMGTPGIEVHIGNFIEEDVSMLPAPEAIFIGGHGGKLKEIVYKVAQYMDSQAKIVFNSVSKESSELFEEAIKNTDLSIHSRMDVTIDQYNPIKIITAINKHYVQ